MGLLALFSLITVTFVVVARQHKRGTQQAAKLEQTGDFPEALLREAFLQIARGTNNRNSVLGPHSLLEDMYGTDALLATVTNGRSAALFGNQLLQFTAASSGRVFNLSTNYYSGRVLTFKTGALAGKTARIVGSVSPTGNATNVMFTVLCDGVQIQSSLVVDARGRQALNDNDEFVINGAAFNGTGFGFNPTQAASFTVGGVLLNHLDPSLSSLLTGGNGYFGLTPNLRPALFNALPATYLDVAGLGGADEEYDAADYQNMLLAVRNFVNMGGGLGSSVPIPSLHRPDLINYWLRQLDTNSSVATSISDPKERAEVILRPDIAYNAGRHTTEAQAILRLKRRISMRPLIEDHPNFTGSNPYAPSPAGNPFAASGGISSGSVADADTNGDGTIDASDRLWFLMGPWDVDNDSDGQMDSIWVDIGLPVQTAKNGRMYKPLVAILCEDMDGKLNLNTHGNVNHLVQGGSVQGTAGTGTNSATTVYGPYAGGNATLPIGQGYGPAEVNLTNTSVIPPADFANLLFGVTGTTAIAGRYGETGFATSNSTYLPISAGISVERNTIWSPGTTRALADRPDWASWCQHYDMPNNYAVTTANVSNDGRLTIYGAPPDLDGDGVLGLDPAGNEFYAGIGGTWIGTTTSVAQLGSRSFAFGIGETGDKWNNPYQLDLSYQARNGGYQPSNYDGAEATSTVAIDAPFKATELERALRYNDMDATSLPSRLFDLTTGTFNTDGKRRFFTTDSWDVPTPVLSATADEIMSLVSPITANTTVTAKSLFGTNNLNDPVLTAGIATGVTIAERLGLAIDRTSGSVNMQTAVLSLLGPELAQGLRLDLNRPFGNGFDDNNNYVVDEPNEVIASKSNQIDDNNDGNVDDQSENSGDGLWPTYNTAWAASYTDTASQPISFDHSHASTKLRSGAQVTPTARAPSEGERDRIDLARNLYCLAAMLVDQMFLKDYRDTTLGGASVNVPAADRQVEMMRPLAQWAVNVVDYRDADSIMTGFEFDAFPFSDEDGDGNYWDVDGNLTTQETTTAFTAKMRGLVWGCERPELLITETAAWHDRRATDEPDEKPAGSPGAPSTGKVGTTSPNTDDDYDQKYRPQGSLVFELYNPWVPANASGKVDPTHLPQELYGLINTSVITPQPPAVMLDRVVAGSPVWRVLVTVADQTPDKRPLDAAKVQSNNFERVIYFTAPANDPGPTDSDNGAAKRYFISSPAANTLGVRPGGYAVVGPDSVTHLGRGTAGGPYAASINLGMPSAASSSTLSVTGTSQSTQTNIYSKMMPVSDAPANDTQMQRPLCVVIDRDESGAARLNISEPLKPTVYNDTLFDRDGRWQPNAGNSDLSAYTPPYDQPFDHNRTDLPSTVIDRPDLSAGNTLNLFKQDNTYYGYRHLHLQRLANPLMPWNASTNPYITIDSLPIDLTVYNGLEASSDPSLPAAGTVHFDSRQRSGGEMQNGAVVKNYNIWCQSLDTQGPVATAPNLTGDRANSGTVLAPAPEHTFGFLNEPMGGLASTVIIGNSSSGNNYGPAYIGMPSTKAFPSFPWPNRPFVSQYELMNVPVLGPSKLLAQIGSRSAGTGRFDSALRQEGMIYTNAAFPHLLPFFETTTYAGTPVRRPELYRLFDYVHVPSRFAGTETWLNPNSFNPAAIPATTWATSFLPRLYAPFNKLSRYREPGKININTIFDDTGLVWQAISNNYPNWAMTWQAVQQSRHESADTTTLLGDNTTTPLNLARWNAFADRPSIFINPFRGSGGHYLVPQQFPGAPQTGREATLLRKNPALAGSDYTLLETQNTNAAVDTSRNPQFDYQLLTKLGNILTTRSNVYAVWITLGYFEVNRTTVDEGNPDGWELGRELGSDTGEIQRHRAFFMFDRSIPVGFQRGQDLNVLDAVLIQRFIE